MGTNYYACRTRPTTAEPIHIGKNSYGWLFCFQDQYEPDLDPPVIWHNYDEVVAWLRKNTVEERNYVILDEYDREVSLDDFIAMVQASQNDPHDLKNPDNFTYNRNEGGYRFCDGEFC